MKQRIILLSGSCLNLEQNLQTLINLLILLFILFSSIKYQHIFLFLFKIISKIKLNLSLGPQTQKLWLSRNKEKILRGKFQFVSQKRF